MRPLSLWRHEVRRAGWAALLAPLIAAVGLAVVAVDGAIRLDQPSGSTALVLQSLLELALPLAAGMGAANLVGRDPVVELLTSRNACVQQVPARPVPTARVEGCAHGLKDWLGLLKLSLGVPASGRGRVR
jgi:hypothetical protein